VTLARDAATFVPAPKRDFGDLSGSAMVVLQIALAFAILLAWQGAAGRIVPVFLISNPVEIAHKLASWVADGSIFVHLWVTKRCWAFCSGRPWASCSGSRSGSRAS
jgi:ABC-type nitrate/sulfonate/bicarbonate transport system permease component